MRIRIIIIAAALLWLSSPVICETINWKPYDEGMRQASREGKKIFLHFRTDWCGYCTQMEKETFSNASVITFLSRHFVAVKVDGDKEKDVGKGYNVKGYPDNRFLDENAEEVYRLAGFLKPDVFLFFLEYIQTNSYKTMSPEQYYQSR